MVEVVSILTSMIKAFAVKMRSVTLFTLLMLGALTVGSMAEPSQLCKTDHTQTYEAEKRLENNEFNYMPVKVEEISSFKVYVKSASNAYLNFISMDNRGSPITTDDAHNGHIVLGGWENQKSGAYCHNSQEWTEYDTPNILSAEEYREFEVKWETVNGMFIVQIYDGSGILVLKHEFVCVSNFGYIGYASAWVPNLEADWSFCFGCVDEANNCAEINYHGYCNEDGPYSEECREACLKTCGVCTPADKREEDKMTRKNEIRKLLDDMLGI